ncbi:MAG TPA: hypothetical protein VLV83_04370 [Acidobacteriota bacterium]|nr:hypothetical protein [Acidobacteriota bacterium]
MDNYDLQDFKEDPTAYRELIPAETLVVEDGRITGLETPSSVRFRDGQGRIRPVAPFLEVWAAFEDEGSLEPLTAQHLEDLGLSPSDMRWRVRTANLKAFRRTGRDGDKVEADSGPFSDHQNHDLRGECVNFKDGKSIPFGSVQYLEPNDEFPEIRLRFVPGPGKVYGPAAGDPNTVDDVYDASRGTWDNHFDGQPGTPTSTVPGNIYTGRFNSQTGRYVSVGYLDDACDGIVEVSLDLPAEDGGQAETLTALARISSGPPDFAPDSLHVRNLADELEQMALGPEVEDVEASRPQEIVRHALDTVRLMETRVMNGNQNVGGVGNNSNNMAGQDQGYGRAFEPIFNMNVDPSAVRNFHANTVQALADGSNAWFLDIVRQFREVGDLSNAGRHKMPAMMRGSDGLHLALTRRQRAQIQASAEGRVIRDEEPDQPEPPADASPEDDLRRLIQHFQSRAPLHAGIPSGAEPLSSRFADPDQLIQHLLNQPAQGALSGAVRGQPLVVPGDPANSAIVRILRNPGHPMNAPFSRPVPGTGRTGLEVIERWIASLS